MSFLSKSRGWKLPALAVAGVLFAIYTVLSRPADPPRLPLTPPPESTFDKRVSGIGIIEPKSEFIYLGVEIPGIVRTVHVKSGDLVKKGEPLFTQDTRDIESQIKTLTASLESGRIRKENAEVLFENLKPISNPRIISKDLYNQRKYALLLASSNVKEIESNLHQAETTLERLSTKAPIDGQILQMNIHPGEMVQGATQPNGLPWILMGDTSSLHVRVEIDEEQLYHLSPGAKATGAFRGETTKSIPLTFVRFEPHVRAKQNIGNSGQRVDTRVIQALFALPKDTPQAIPGLQMDVFIETK